MTALATYEAARAALAAARRVDEVKGVRDQAEAMRAYARMAKDVDLETDAAELRLRAERRLGEMIAAQRDAGLLKPGGDGSNQHRVSAKPVATSPVTLAEAGIDKNLAHRARLAARIDGADFEAAVSRVRERIAAGGHRVSLDPLDEDRQILARAKDIRAAKQKTRHSVRLAHMDMIAEKGRAAAPGKLDRQYPVYYADPPWRFGVHDEVTGREKSAENHYPTLTTDEIEALLVPMLGGGNPAVLFLWATNPMLRDGLRVMAACGFTYVHHWIWDKEVAGTGYWGRDRHELLLIGRRGAIAVPLPGTQPDTVYREKKGKHSAKPAYFAETIERLYPGVARLELFCRTARPGWDVWGFEADRPIEPVAQSSASNAEARSRAKAGSGSAIKRRAPGSRMVAA